MHYVVSENLGFPLVLAQMKCLIETDGTRRTRERISDTETDTSKIVEVAGEMKDKKSKLCKISTR